MMEGTRITCKYCQYEAPLYMFENVDNGLVKCKRCRSRFEDPHAYSKESAYADCDSRRAVTRFPFALNGRNAMIRVRPGYTALAVGYDGQRLWLTAPKNHISTMTSGFQLYYVRLNPQLSWGIAGLDAFGAYGTAQLALEREAVEAFCREEDGLLGFEEHLRGLVVKRLTEHAARLVELHNTSPLRSSDGYVNALGSLGMGVSLTKVELRGYRDGDKAPVAVAAHSDIPDLPQEDISQDELHPVDILPPPSKRYTVRNGAEEVFLYGPRKTERHKAGEIIDEDMLHGMARLIRFSRKEFSFLNGWGLSNQTCNAPGYYSAHGVISFYIDSTQLLSALLAKTSGWEEFTENFFSNVLRQELSSALKEALDMHLRTQSFDPARLSERLSALSVDLTKILNGETESPRKPAFRQYGLRVNAADILHVNFTSTRR